MNTIHFFTLLSLFYLLISCQSEPATTSPDQPISKSDSNNTYNTLPTASKEVTTPEAFENVPAGVYQNLNEKLAASTSKKTAKEVAQMYYPAKISNKTSFEKIDIQTQKEGTQTIVTITHDNQSEHTSIQGHRIVMTLEKKGTHWQIVSIQQQFKCWIRKENGATWSSDKCS